MENTGTKVPEMQGNNRTNNTAKGIVSSEAFMAVTGTLKK